MIAEPEPVLGSLKPEEVHPAELEASPFHDERRHIEAVPREVEAAGAPLRFVSLEDFAAREEASAKPLLGSSADMVLAAGSTLILYGDGGTSKTTLTLDAVLHLAAGASWLGLTVPRPLTVLLIENEGPRGPFRRKLEQKLASWSGPTVEGRVHVLEDPWGGFSFANERHRAELAGFVSDYKVELVVCGPLVALGAIGAGTPEEVSAFERLLYDFRERTPASVALWLVHHENKAGDVSGAWERLPDTLAHARLEGRQRTLLHWRKARWSSRLHGERWTLRWALEREGFEIVDEEATAAAKAAELEDARGRIAEYVRRNAGASKTAVETAFAEVHGKGGRALARRAINAELTASTPQLVVGTGKSPNGTYLYPASEANSPTRQGVLGEYGESDADPEVGTQLANSPLPCKGEARGGELADGVADDQSELNWR